MPSIISIIVYVMTLRGLQRRFMEERKQRA
jgi:hypothetical protein